MNILAIDTSCDETTAAVTENTKVSSNPVWSQASLHASYGGVMPSLAQRQHQERIDYVINKALGKIYKNLNKIDAIAVTTGPGLAIALGVGINKAKELAKKYTKPLIPVNHIEAHLLSSLAQPQNEEKQKEITFPVLGLVISGGNTQLILIKNINDYVVLAQTSDDALGEALDKAARLLGFGYPGGAILEKFAKNGDFRKYPLPLPLKDDVVKDRFSYSGLKTAFVRLFNSLKEPTKQDISDLAASFQNRAFEHITKVVDYQIKHLNLDIKDFLLGGGVANNIEIRKRLRKLISKYGITLHTPYSSKLNGDNAAMVGVCAYLKYKNKDLKKFFNYDFVDRNPRLRIF